MVLSKFFIVFAFVLQMDGDSSTTDASQLGISGDFMPSGHYVLQSQDGEERTGCRCCENKHQCSQWETDRLCVVFFVDDGDENLNDHEDGGIKENYREQDIYLPIANVARIMKNAVPQTGKVWKGWNGGITVIISIRFLMLYLCGLCHL